MLTDHDQGLGALLPHQADLLAKVQASVPPVRILVTGPTGSGKGTALAAAAGAVGSRSATTTRVLVLAPAAHADYWAHQLREYRFRRPVTMDGRLLRRTESETAAGTNPWSTSDAVITTPDFLKRERQREEEALAADWDVVLIDEVHLYAGSSQRGRLLRRIWESTIPVVIASTATPGQPELLHRDGVTELVQWDASVLTGLAGGRPGRQISVHRYRRSAEEQAFSGLLSGSLEGVAANPAGTMLSTTLLRRSQSSLLAIETSLRRLLDRVETTIAFERLLLSDEGESESGELPDLDELLAGGRGASLDPQACRVLLDALERVPADTKWSACESLLTTVLRATAAKVVVFTEYVDTATYIAAMVEGLPWQSVIMTGASSPEERQDVMARMDTWACLVTTTGASGGLAFDTVTDVIHYDLPWDPVVMEQRIGRTDRISHRGPAARQHVLIAADDASDRLFEVLLRKMKAIEAAFGITLDATEQAAGDR